MRGDASADRPHSRALFHAALACLLAAGCGGDPAVPPPAPALVLATIDDDASAAEPPPGAPVVFTPSAVRRGEAPPILALDHGRFFAAAVRGGDHGYLVEALTRALARVSPEALVLAFDPSVPYETVGRAIYTAGQAGTVNIAFLVQHRGHVQALPIVVPRVGVEARVDPAVAEVLGGGDLGPLPGAPPARTTLALTVSIEATGIVVQGAGGRLSPGCATTGAADGVTVPARSGRPDLPALRACLARVKREFPEEENVIVRAESTTRFEVLANVIATARGTRTEALFPDLSLALSERRP